MSCLVKIRSFLDELSPNERRIARFILENPGLIRDYSSQNLASAVGVSQSSIVKFSQKLGYQGFPDLKLAIHEAVLLGAENGSGQQARQAGNDKQQPLEEQLLQIKTEALRHTMELNDEQNLVTAAKLLEKSERIQVIALGAGSVVARNFASMLIQIGKSVIADVDTYIQLSSIATLGKSDTAFLISFSGQSPHMISILKDAKKAGVKIITLTNYTANPARSLADVQLFSVSNVGDNEIPQIVSSTSQQFVVDLLFSQIVSRSPRARELIARSRQAAENI